jgi:hypothetical protein
MTKYYLGYGTKKRRTCEPQAPSKAKRATREPLKAVATLRNRRDMLEESNSLSDLIHPKTKPFDRNGLDGVNWCEAIVELRARFNVRRHDCTTSRSRRTVCICPEM